MAVWALWIRTAPPGLTIHGPTKLSDERLGPRPRSSPLTDWEWAVLLSHLVVGGRLRTALLVSSGLLHGLTLVGGGGGGAARQCTGSRGPLAAPPWSVPGAAGSGLLRPVPTIRRRLLHPWSLRSASSSLRPAFTSTPGAGRAEHHCLLA